MTEARPVEVDQPGAGGPSDAQLLAACRNGRTDAFGELVCRYQNRIYNLAYRFTGHAHEAEEVAQEAFFKAYRALESFRGESAFYTWLFRIVVNEARSRQRFRAVRPTEVSLSGAHPDSAERAPAEPTGQLHARGEDPAEEAGRAERKRLVERALARLDPEPRMMIVLRDIEGRNYEEIAGLLGCPKGTVKSRLHRARQALKELLAPALGRE